MRLTETEIAGLFVIELDHKRDERGYFARTFCADTLTSNGLVGAFPQCGTAYNNLSGTVRGMHFQAAPYGEVKVIRCTRGAIHDVLVDLRRTSPTYLKSYAIELTESDGRELYVPEGLAHGYQTLRDATEVLYMMSVNYVPGAATGIRWDDPLISVKWPRPISIIAERDRNWPLLELAR
jgi:dTDP-4-dehydrorhamnose 3,5-epimerase